MKKIDNIISSLELMIKTREDNKRIAEVNLERLNNELNELKAKLFIAKKNKSA